MRRENVFFLRMTWRHVSTYSDKSHSTEATGQLRLPETGFGYFSVIGLKGWGVLCYKKKVGHFVGITLKGWVP